MNESGESNRLNRGSSSEEFMDADLRERDAFVERLLKKDEKITTISDQGLSSTQIRDISLRGSLHELHGWNSNDDVSKLREISRQQYLAKREKKEVELLEKSLQDDEYFFEGVHLSKDEEERNELQRKILGIARNKHRSEYRDTVYSIPDGKVNLCDGTQLEKSRYQEEINELTEQEKWEDDRFKSANFHFGSSASTGKVNDDYDFVFGDEIQFVPTNQSSNTRKNKKRENSKNSTIDTNTEVLDLSEHERILRGREELPVFPYREEFLKAVQQNKVLVVVGETGSGKTTQIPQYLHEAGWSKIGKVGCTQPRRVAAMSVAARVAQEMNCKLGHEVGYSIRFEDCTNDSTIIKYMTDGMLLREFMTVPDLSLYSVMMIDEAHERTLHTDILFGLVKDVCRFRADDFRLIISSATLDAEKFATYFDDASVFTIPGRMFPVDILYTNVPEADYIDAAVVTILQIHMTQELPGDILVFLSGQEEIESATEVLHARVKSMGSRIRMLSVCPIYSSLPNDMQAKIFEKTEIGARKVVIGTNIAETSLTIDGICYVIDAGFCKQKSYNPRTGMESLIVTPVSKAAANQRAGRAGRTQPGKCFRLYTIWSYQHELTQNTVPEVQRTCMNSVVLMLKSLGINDLLHFDFMDKPPADSIMRALEQLYALGALNDRGELTKIGRKMAEFPVDPMMSKAILASEKFGCLNEILTIVSMLSMGTSVFYRPKERALHADTAKLIFSRGGGGDHMTLLRCYNKWMHNEYSTQWCYENYVQIRSMMKARNIREQLEGLCERVELQVSSKVDEVDIICKAMTAGYFHNTSILSKSGGYRTIKNQYTVHIHPSSVLYNNENLHEWLLYHELTFTTKEYMRMVAPIQGSWLLDIAPHYYQSKDITVDSGIKRKLQIN